MKSKHAEEKKPADIAPEVLHFHRPIDCLTDDPSIDAIEWETGGRILRLERGQPLVEYTGRALEDRCAARLTVPK